MTDADAPVPTGAAHRAAIVGSGAARVGLARLGAAVGATSRETADRASARALFGALGQLKGTALKLAQMLSLESGLMPEAWVEELEKAHYRAPALSGTMAASIVEAELGGRPEAVFARFERRAFAAASLGQVHRAESRRGLPLAVKVQYPGIDRAIAADLRLLRRLFRVLPEARFAGAALEELRVRLREEVDYEREAASTAWFREHLDVEGVVVPRVMRSRSTRVVLATERLPGEHVDEWLATSPDADTRDLAAQRLLAVFARSLHTLHRVHADANLGNFLFQPDGTVGLLDFGCTKTLPPAVADAKAGILRGLLDDRRADVDAIYRRLGVFGSAPEAEARRLRARHLGPIEAWMIEPLRVDRFDFAADPTFCDRGRRAFQQMMADRTRVRLPRDLIYIERTHYGLYRLFQRLRARVDVRPLLST